MNAEASAIEGRVLFVTYGGGHAAALAPVMATLGRASVPWCTLALTTAKSHLERQGLAALSMAKVADAVPGYRGVRRVGRILARGQSQHSAVSREDTEAYLGVGFHALARSLGLPKARAVYGHGGRQRFRPVDFFRAWFQLHRPAVVVATSAPRSERAALEAARNLNIPSVCVVDLYAPFEIEWCASPGYASRICVLNEPVARRFRDRGVPAERVVVTGNPAFDRLDRLDVARLRRESRAAMGLADNQPLVSWMSQPEPERHPFSGAVGDPRLPERIEHHLADGLAQRPSLQLVLRLHPSEDRPRALAGPRIRYSDSTQPLDALLCASDCVVTCSSTVGLEAALLGIPVVQCMDSIFSPDLPLSELGFARAVDGHRQLWPAIDDVLSAAPHSVAHRAAGPDACGATEQIARQIVQLYN
jgi:hypothetical protein